jgi:hypothetical protein
MSAGLTCKAFVPAVHQTIAAKTALAITEIQEILKCAAFFNKQILVLTKGRGSLIKSDPPDLTVDNYTFFRFDQKKWEEILKQISNKTDHPAQPCRTADLAEECQLDLIEALAEYNIDSTLLEKILSGAVIDWRDQMRFEKKSSVPLEQLEMDRFINMISLTPVDHPESNFTKQLQDILTQAKNTLKGNIKIDQHYGTRFMGCNNLSQKSIEGILKAILLQGQYVKTILRDKRLFLIGPYIYPIYVWNLECASWNQGEYQYLRYTRAAPFAMIHLDYILRKAGGRIDKATIFL